MRLKQFSVLFAIFFLVSLPFGSASSVNRVVQASGSPGSPVPVRFNIVMNDNEDYYVLNDRFPAGWSVTNLGGGVVGADGVWRLTVDPAVSSSGTVGYDLDVPFGASGAYSFTGTFGTVGGTGGSSSSVSIGGSNSVNIAGTGAVISIVPSSQTVQTGSTPFSIDVYVSGAIDLYGVQFDLSFDDSILTFQSAVEDNELLGQSLGAGGSVVDSNNLGGVDLQPGMINDFVVLRSGVSSGVTGSGKIATVTFAPSSNGTTSLVLSNVVLANPNGVSLSHTVQNGAVESGFCGDGTTQAALGETCDDTNTDNGDGCSASCGLLTCVGQGGDVCTTGEVCTGNPVDSADSATCCDVACSPPAWNTCGECGNGFFNACDQNECEVLISESCFFTDTGFPGDGYGSCDSCSGGSCSVYGGFQSTCELNVCGFGPETCVFDSGSGMCEAAITESDCTDGSDNDGDSLVDCADPDCAGLEGPNAGVTCCQGVGDCANGECTSESCSGSNECVYVDRPAGDYTECTGECEACDVAGGVCAPVSSNEGSQCSGECTYCNSGVCENRAEGDFVECTGECEACSLGTCTPGTYVEAALCEDPGQYCSAGNCCNDENNDNICDTCSINEECDSPYSCATGVCNAGSCDIDISGCDCGTPVLNVDGFTLDVPGTDVNGDGFVGLLDLIFVAGEYNESPFNQLADVVDDNEINIADLIFIATRIGICPNEP